MQIYIIKTMRHAIHVESLYKTVVFIGFHGRRGGERQILDANPCVCARFLQLEKDLHPDGVATRRVRQRRQGVQRVGEAADGGKSPCRGQHGALELQSLWVLIASVFAKSFQEILFSLQIQRLRNLWFSFFSFLLVGSHILLPIPNVVDLQNNHCGRHSF